MPGRIGDGRGASRLGPADARAVRALHELLAVVGLGESAVVGEFARIAVWRVRRTRALLDDRLVARSPGPTTSTSPATAYSKKPACSTHAPATVAAPSTTTASCYTNSSPNVWALACRRLPGERLLYWHGETDIEPLPEARQQRGRLDGYRSVESLRTPQPAAAPRRHPRARRRRQSRRIDHAPRRLRPHPPTRQELGQVPPLRRLPLLLGAALHLR